MGPNNILRQLENKEIIGSETIDDIDCYKLTGNSKYGGDLNTIWIQKSNFLIRRKSNGRQSAIGVSNVKNRTTQNKCYIV